MYYGKSLWTSYQLTRTDRFCRHTPCFFCWFVTHTSTSGLSIDIHLALRCVAPWAAQSWRSHRWWKREPGWGKPGDERWQREQCCWFAWVPNGMRFGWWISRRQDDRNCSLMSLMCLKFRVVVKENWWVTQGEKNVKMMEFVQVVLQKSWVLKWFLALFPYHGTTHDVVFSLRSPEMSKA